MVKSMKLLFIVGACMTYHLVVFSDEGCAETSCPIGDLTAEKTKKDTQSQTSTDTKMQEEQAEE